MGAHPRRRRGSSATATPARSLAERDRRRPGSRALGPAVRRRRTDRGCRSCSRCSPRPGRCRCRRIRAAAQAAAGFADEERRGIALDDPQRNYADAQPQAGDALRAHRVPRAVRLPSRRRDGRAARARSASPALAPTSTRCGRSRTRDGVRAVAHGGCCTCPTADRAARGRDVAGRCARPRRRRRRRTPALAQTVVELAARYPGDVGVRLRAAHAPRHARSRARRSSSPPATCTRTCAASASRSWPARTTSCAAG